MVLFSFLVGDLSVLCVFLTLSRDPLVNKCKWLVFWNVPMPVVLICLSCLIENFMILSALINDVLSNVETCVIEWLLGIGSNFIHSSRIKN